MQDKSLSKDKSELYLNELKTIAQHLGTDFSEEIKSIETKLFQTRGQDITQLELKKSDSAWNSVQKARMKGRPTAIEYIEHLSPDFIELHGDRGFKDDAAIIGGIGTLNGVCCTFIGHQKGRDVNENVKRNFGMPHPEGYRKAIRLMKQAEKFNRPILCFIDTPGAYCGLGAEERGQGEAIARSMMVMAELTVPIISIIIGEGGSGGALALGIGNRVYMMENAIYSVLSPEGFASILWKDSTRAAEAAQLMRITSSDLAEFNIVDGIIKETWDPDLNKAETFNEVLRFLSGTLKELLLMSKEQLIEERGKKFRNIGI